MLNQSGVSETSVDIEKEKQDRLIQRQRIECEGPYAQTGSIKPKVKFLIQNILEDLKKDLQQSSKDMKNLKMELGTLKNSHAIQCEDMTKHVINQVTRLGNELNKKSNETEKELDFCDAQMKQLLLDKKKLDDTSKILETRVQSCESDVGFRHVYD